MNYSVVFDRSVIAGTARDLRMLRGDGDAVYSDRIWDRTTRVYFPPGLWYLMNPGAGRPHAYRLPAPLHPLEALAAVRGWGGIEGLTPPDPEWFAGARNRSWLAHVDALAGYLFLTPQQSRLLYHVLTPLQTNGGQPDNYDTDSYNARAELYRASGVPTPDWAATAAYWDAQSWGGPPGRAGFWGLEIQGEVRL